MKQTVSFLTVIVLTLTLLTGCGCTMQKQPPTTPPTRATAPTNPATVAPTTPATETVPHTSNPMDETGVIGSETPTDSGTEGSMPGSGAKTRNRMR